MFAPADSASQHRKVDLDLPNNFHNKRLHIHNFGLKAIIGHFGEP